jgi:hypothetical protein
VVKYGKVIRNFAEFEKSHSLKIFDCSTDFRIDLANELADIAARYGIRMFSCCGDYLVNDKIKKAHCIDGQIIQELFSPEGFSYKHKPTRDECGCTESTCILLCKYEQAKCQQSFQKPQQNQRLLRLHKKPIRQMAQRNQGGKSTKRR